MRYEKKGKRSEKRMCVAARLGGGQELNPQSSIGARTALQTKCVRSVKNILWATENAERLQRGELLSEREDDD